MGCLQVLYFHMGYANVLFLLPLTAQLGISFVGGWWNGLWTGLWTMEGRPLVHLIENARMCD